MKVPTVFLAIPVALGAPALAQTAPDAARGHVLFLQCAACHSAAKDVPNKVGPNLYGIVGAHAGSRAGYSYSPVFQKADFTWDEAHLDRFLSKPTEVMPGTKMLFGGIADPAKRADIIAYLKTLK